MLTDLITRRFAKHHNYLLASLDALEAAVQEISQAPEPAAVFLSQEAAIIQILDFLAGEEAQHEREEERVLLPVLERHLDRRLPPATALEQVSDDHRRGQELIRIAREQMSGMAAADPTPRDYILLTARLSDIVWHYRRHVWKENSIILPAARRLVPDHADSIWAAGPGSKE
jgi:iron-sulfur cluster repair protein YtfE (RIC family)